MRVVLKRRAMPSEQLPLRNRPQPDHKPHRSPALATKITRHRHNIARKPRRLRRVAASLMGCLQAVSGFLIDRVALVAAWCDEGFPLAAATQRRVPSPTNPANGTGDDRGAADRHARADPGERVLRRRRVLPGSRTPLSPGTESRKGMPVHGSRCKRSARSASTSQRASSGSRSPRSGSGFSASRPSRI